MAKRPITDELLKLTIENKLETGVDASRIRVLIEAFASDESEREPAEEIVGFLWVEDIPHDRRGTFLTALLALSQEPKLAVASLRRPASQSPTASGSLLTRAMAALRLAPA
jgi:hypothetical protein